MSKLRERLSPIHRQRVGTRFQTSLKRVGNIERGKGLAPITVSRARIKRDTGLKRKGPTARATKHEGEYGKKLTASRISNMKPYSRLYELVIAEWMCGEDQEQYEGRPSRKNVTKKPTRASKKTKAAADRAKKKEANTSTKVFKKGTYTQQRGK